MTKKAIKTTAPAGKKTPAAKHGKKEVITVTGMRDILPQDQSYWEMTRKIGEKVANDYGYGRIDSPILEYSELFVRGVGKQTDIVEKEMFSFIDQGGDQLSLRPEATASVVRAYLQHGIINQLQPVRFFYFGPMFRHEKPQSGRFRQFFQLGYEAIGEENPALDAQLILMGYNILNELGLKTTIQINSFGCPECREEYKKNLIKYYKTKTKLLCENCKKRLVKNPLRLLDCKEDGCRSLRDEAPQILDYLDDGCKNHFMKMIEYLDELDLPYALNPYIVRGLDYYNRTIFEYWSEDDIEGKNALGGGGRYDGLISILGGREETPACGLALGVDRIVAKLREKEISAPEVFQPDVFVAQLGDAAKKKTFILYEKLRRKGFKLAQAFFKDSLKNQLNLANKLKVKFTLILGQKEIGDGTIIMRDMRGGIQEIIDYNKTENELKKRLEKYEEIEGLIVSEEEAEADKTLPGKRGPRRASREDAIINELVEEEGVDLDLGPELEIEE